MRKYPTSRLDMQKLENLYREREKINKNKLERKQKRQKVEDEKRKQREEKEKAQQELIMAEKQKLYEERDKQREASKRGLKRYNIFAIEFDWLFNEQHGRDFLVDLTLTQSLDIFGIDIIVKIILFLWMYYRRAIVLNILLPFLVYFIAFLIYATYIYHEKEEENDRDDPWYSINTILIVVILICIIYNILFEVRKLFFYRSKYFRSYWNAINFASIILNTFVLLSDLAELSKDIVIQFLAVAVLLMWLKLLYFGRMFFSTAWMVRMIGAVARDMIPFLIIFSISVISFANAYVIISRNGDPPAAGDSFFDSIVYSYK